MLPEDDRPQGASTGDDQHRFGRYRVERLIGSGPLGAVFLGRDPILGRPVAVKRIALRVGRLPADSAERLRELERAFGSLGSLAHPHIVTVHDAGVQDDQAYLVSEYVPGTSLQPLLAGAPLPTQQVASLAAQIATALDHAHGLGVAHGQVKPSNVLVARSGPAKLSDFGVAVALATSRLGHNEWMTAVPGYLAPELITDGKADARSDQWSLAVLLFEMLTGELPFAASDIDALLEEITEHPPQPPTLKRPSLSTDVDLVLLQALDRDPTRRYASCGELVRRLASALDHATVPTVGTFSTQPLDEDLRRILERTQPVDEDSRAQTQPTPPRQPAPRTKNRSRAVLPWLAAAVLLLSVVAVATRNSWMGPEGRIEPPPPLPTSPWEAVHTEPPTAPAASVPAADPAPSSTDSDGATAPARTERTRLRLELSTEIPNGIVSVWVGDEKVFGERFQFGGPMRFLRGSETSSVRRSLDVPAGRRQVRVRTVLSADDISEQVLSATLGEAERTLEVRILSDRRVEARLY